MRERDERDGTEFGLKRDHRRIEYRPSGTHPGAEDGAMRGRLMLGMVPAALLGFNDRGTIQVGGWADMMIFDPETIGLVDEPTQGGVAVVEAVGERVLGSQPVVDADDDGVHRGRDRVQRRRVVCGERVPSRLRMARHLRRQRGDRASGPGRVAIPTINAPDLQKEAAKRKA